MCLKCHSQMSNKDVIRQLEEAIQNPEFEKWNITSLNHTLLSLRGFDGATAHYLSKILLEMLYDTNPKIEYFPSRSEIREYIDESVEFYNQYKQEVCSNV